MQHLALYRRVTVLSWLGFSWLATQATLTWGCRVDSGSDPASEAPAGSTAPPAQTTSPALPAGARADSTPAAPAGNDNGVPAGAAAPSPNEQPPLPTERAPTPAPPPAASAEPTGGAAGSAPTPPTAPTTPPPAAPPPGPLTLFLAGDSTVQTYADTASAGDLAGWGQMLAQHVARDITVDNRAIGGRTARRFIDEGRLDEILSALLPGDYLLVQFGTNDGNRTATYELGDQTIPYYLDPATDFKNYLQQYLDGARERGAVPVLVTPPPRNSAYCTGGNGTGAHAQAMRELGQAQSASVVDLNALSVAYLTAICPAPVPENFFLLRADGSVDGTHFQENGARILAGFVASALREVEPALAPLIE